MSLEANEIFYTFQGQAIDDHVADPYEPNKISKTEALIKFVKFIREWKADNQFIYR